MFFGEGNNLHWDWGVLGTALGGLLGTVGSWFYNLWSKAKDKSHQIKIEDQTLERQGNEFLFKRFTELITGYSGELKELQDDHVKCREENARQRQEITQLGERVAELLVRIEQDRKQMEELKQRIRDLENKII